MENQSFTNIRIKDLPMNCLITFFDFLDMNTFFNFELCCKEFQSIISTYYQYKENIAEVQIHNKEFINYKRQFLSKRYFNLIIEGLITKEYYNDELKELCNGTIEHKVKYSNVGNTLINNSLQFKQIEFYDYDSVCVLHHFNLIQIYTLDKQHSQLTLKYSNKQSTQSDLTCFVFISDKKIFIFTDNNMNFYTLSIPQQNQQTECVLHKVETKIKFNIKGELNYPITKLYYIKEYLIFLNDKGNFYYMILDNFPLYKSTSIDAVYPLPITRNYNEILSISASHSSIMVMDNSFTLYYLTANEITKTKTVEIQFHILNDFKFPNFYTMHNGDSHSLILEKEKMPPLEQYTNEQVHSWFEEMQLDDYLNIIKYEKITGKDIIKADKTFFINCLGMEEEEINKVNYEISKIKNGYYKNIKLWGWGSNKYGQLVVADSSKPFIKTQQRVVLPLLQNEMDSIEKVYCGKTYSIIISHNGNVYITGNYLIKEKQNKNEGDGQDNGDGKRGNKYKRNNHIKDNNKKLARKNERKEKKMHEMKIVQEKWIDITKDVCFDSICDDNSIFFKVKDVLMFKEKVLFCGNQSTSIPFNMVIKKAKFKHEKKGERFIACDKLIKLILSYKNEIIQTFSVVYGDAKLKMLETKLLDFLESEVQYHKIEQIKRMGEIIWDRKKRYLNNEFSMQVIYNNILEQ